MNNNKKQEKKDLIKIIVSILVILSVMTVQKMNQNMKHL